MERNSEQYTQTTNLGAVDTDSVTFPRISLTRLKKLEIPPR